MQHRALVVKCQVYQSLKPLRRHRQKKTKHLIRIFPTEVLFNTRKKCLSALLLLGISLRVQQVTIHTHLTFHVHFQVNRRESLKASSGVPSNIKSTC